MTVKKANFRVIATSIRRFWELRESKNAVEEALKVQQPEVITAMRAVDPHNDGIVWNPDDPNKGTAYVQQNSGGTFWDQEAIIEWLHQDKARWARCSSRVFDVQKWEAEVANGGIPPKVASSFKRAGNPPSPFVRFGKPGPNSISGD